MVGPARLFPGGVARLPRTPNGGAMDADRTRIDRATRLEWLNIPQPLLCWLLTFVGWLKASEESVELNIKKQNVYIKKKWFLDKLGG